MDRVREPGVVDLLGAMYRVPSTLRPMTTTPLRCSKMGAALAQLDEAIFMYFNQRDPLATHTLVAAAYQILSDLHGPGFVERSLRQYVEPDEAQKVIAGIRNSQNFLKHADRDPDSILDFDPAVTEYLLLECLFIYVEHVDSSPKLTPNMKAYENWFVVHHPEIMQRYPELGRLADAAKHTGIHKLPRSEFYRQSLEAYQRSYGS